MPDARRTAIEPRYLLDNFAMTRYAGSGDRIVHMIFSVAVSGVGLLAFLGHTDEDSGVIALTEPQTWTTIGVLAAALLGTITLVSTMLMRTITAQIGGLRGEIGGLRGEISGLHGEMGGLRGEMVSGFSSVRSELRSEIGGLRAEMNARFEAVDARFDTVNTKIEGLDRDVQLLMNREFGKDRE